MNKNLRTLIRHQAWRTGSDDAMIDPAELSTAINWAISELTQRVTTDNTAVIMSLSHEVESLQDKLNAETRARKDAQLIGQDLASQFERYGMVVSAALKGKRHPSEPDNDGRMDAVRAMAEENNALRFHVEMSRDEAVDDALRNYAAQWREPQVNGPFAREMVYADIIDHADRLIELSIRAQRRDDASLAEIEENLI